MKKIILCLIASFFALSMWGAQATLPAGTTIFFCMDDGYGHNWMENNAAFVINFYDGETYKDNVQATRIGETKYYAVQISDKAANATAVQILRRDPAHVWDGGATYQWNYSDKQTFAARTSDSQNMLSVSEWNNCTLNWLEYAPQLQASWIDNWATWKDMTPAGGQDITVYRYNAGCMPAGTDYQFMLRNKTINDVWYNFDNVASTCSSNITLHRYSEQYKNFTFDLDDFCNVVITITLVGTGASVHVEATPVNLCSGAFAASSGNAAAGADRNTGSRWESDHTDVQVWQMNLNEAMTFDHVRIIWEGAYGKSFDILAGDACDNMTVINEVRNQTLNGFVDNHYTQIIDLGRSVTASHIRFRGIARGTVYGYSFWEFEPYTAVVPVLSDLNFTAAGTLCKVGAGSVALTATPKDQYDQPFDVEVTYTVTPASAGHVTSNVYYADAAGTATITATAGTINKNVTIINYAGENRVLSTNIVSDNKIIAQSCDLVGAHNAFFAVDANEGSIWEPISGTGAVRDTVCWFVADMGALYDLEFATVKFEGASSKAYTIEVSADNVSWTAVANGTTSGMSTVTNIHDLSTAAGVRYVKYHSTRNATEYGHKMFDFKVFGVEAAGGLNVRASASPVGAGTVTVKDGETPVVRVASGTTVTFTATPTPGAHYGFDKWSDDITTNPRNITVTEDTELTAIFARNEFVMTAVSEDEDMGTAAVDNEVVAKDGTATFTATPAAHYRFVRWSDDSTDRVHAVTATEDLELTAYFERSEYEVSVSVNNGEWGSASVKQSGSDVTYAAVGSDVDYIAEANDGYILQGWYDGGTLVSTDANYTVEDIQAAVSLEARFRALNNIYCHTELTNAGGDKTIYLTMKRTAENQYQVIIDSEEEMVGFSNAYIGGRFVDVDNREELQLNQPYAAPFVTVSDNKHRLTVDVTSTKPIKWNSPLYINMPGEVTFNLPESPQGKTVEYDVDCESVAVESISISQTEATIATETSVRLIATIAPVYATNKGVTWTSSDETKETVVDGVVTGIAAGSATITARSDADPTKYQTCVVTVFVDETVPQTPAQAPNTNGIIYRSLYSDVLTPALEHGFRHNTWGGASWEERTVGGNHYYLYNTSESRTASWGDTGNGETSIIAKPGYNNGVEQGLDVSGMNFVHVDVWSKVAVANFNVCVDNDVIATASVAGDGWSSLDIDISAIEANRRDNIHILKFTNMPEATNVAIDNVYFWKFDPATCHALTATADPAEGGTVTTKARNVVSNLVPNGENATFIAELNPTYRFVNWTDNNNSNAQVATTTTYVEENVTAPVALTAHFMKTYSVSATSADGEMGSAAVTQNDAPASTVDAGSSVTFTATPNTGYTFVRWSDGSTANPYEVASVSADMNLTATFEVGRTVYCHTPVYAGSGQKLYLTLGETATAGQYRILFEGTASCPILELNGARFVINGVATDIPYADEAMSGDNVPFSKTDGRWSFSAANYGSASAVFTLADGSTWRDIYVWDAVIWFQIASREISFSAFPARNDIDWTNRCTEVGAPVINSTSVNLLKANSVILNVDATDDVFDINYVTVTESTHGIDVKMPIVDGKITISGLTPSTTYSFKLTATNAAGATSTVYNMASITTGGQYPSTGAPVPPVRNDGHIRSVYSDKYVSAVKPEYKRDGDGWGVNISYEERTIDDDTFAYYSCNGTATEIIWGMYDGGVRGIMAIKDKYADLPDYHGLDVRTMEKMHVDIWCESSRTLTIMLTDGILANVNHTGNGWESFDLSLSDYSHPGTGGFPGKQLNSVEWIKFQGFNNTDYFAIDNVYFYVEAPNHTIPVSAAVAVSDQELGTATVTVGGENWYVAEMNEAVTFTATPTEGVRFDRWTNGAGETVVGAGATYIPSITAETHLTAHFVKTWDLQVVSKLVDGESYGTVSAMAGAVDVNNTTLDDGTFVRITATPNSGKHFKYWARDGEYWTRENPYDLTMDRDMEIRAIFEDELQNIDHLRIAGNEGSHVQITCYSLGSNYYRILFTGTEDCHLTGMYDNVNLVIHNVNGELSQRFSADDFQSIPYGVGYVYLDFMAADVDLIKIAPEFHYVPLYKMRAGANGSDLVEVYIPTGGIDWSFNNVAPLPAVLGTSGDWSNTASWRDGKLPDENTDVFILNPCSVDVANAQAHNVYIYNEFTGDFPGHSVETHTGGLTIGAQGGLAIYGKLKNVTHHDFFEHVQPTRPSDLLIESSAAGQGALAIASEDGTNQYTAHLFSRAIGTPSAQVYQYIGVPFGISSALYTFYGSWLYQWVEGTGWDRVANGGSLSAWEGYSVAYNQNEDPGCTSHTYVLDGAMQPTASGHVYNLTHSGTNPGRNLIANSWTAPIRIKDINFGANAQETVYLFQTGSYSAAKSSGGSQWITIPKSAASYISPNAVIPPMQAFQVNVNAATTLTVDYQTAVMPRAVGDNLHTEPLHAPSRHSAEEEQQIDVLHLNVMGSRFGDDLYILRGDDFSTGYENGWDGIKMMGDALAPQLFALAGSDFMAVDAVDEMDGIWLGLRNGEDSFYTITMNYNGDETLYLYDKEADIYTRIEEGATYSFVITKTGTRKRFQITSYGGAQVPTDIDDVQVAADGSCISNLSGERLHIAIYDAAGRLFTDYYSMETVIRPIVPEELGVYVISVSGKHTQVVRKVVR